MIETGAGIGTLLDRSELYSHSEKRSPLIHSLCYRSI